MNGLMKGSLCPQETFHYEDLNELGEKTNFAICYDLHNKGRCILSQTGDSWKTKSDGRELITIVNNLVPKFNVKTFIFIVTL